jgi:DNA helicase IV
MPSTWWKDPSDLIKEQLDILELPPDKSLLIKGPPGSGKTNLLLLRANYMFLADKPNIGVVVLGSVLRNFIQLGSDLYKFPRDKVMTHARLFSTVMGENDVKVDTTGMEFEEARAARIAAIESLGGTKLGAIYQGLLLDEAQDYLPSEVTLLRKLSEVLVATCDSKQKIYAGEDCVSVLEKSVDQCYELHYHFRNGREICRVADAIMQGKPDYIPMTKHSQYDEKEYPSSVFVKNGMSVQAQAQAIAAQLQDQRLAYPEEVIGVMCPRNEELTVIQAELNSTALASEVTRCNETGFDPGKHIWLTTISAAKGLEFRAAHLAGLDYLSSTGRGAQKRLAFTAVTRAKTALSIYFENSVPGYLDNAIRIVVPQKKAISKAMIFGKE